MIKDSRKPIDWQQFEQLCALQATQGEIASMLRVHPDTLRDSTEEQYGAPYSAVYKMFSDNGKCSVRRNQFVMSKRNASMAIWLGKQWLDQKDHMEVDKAPQDANLNYADAYIKSEGEKIALAKKVEELEKKLEELMNQVTRESNNPKYQVPMPILSPVAPYFVAPPHVVTCSNVNETMNQMRNDGSNPQPEANSGLYGSNEEI